MKKIPFYLDGKNCILSIKRLLPNCYHLLFEDDYTKKKFGNHVDVMIDEEGEMTRVYPALTDTILLPPASEAIRDTQVRHIWNTVRQLVLPALQH